MKGLFITFEGPDGSGKSTQLQLLAEKLTNDGLEPLVTREPGGTYISDKIRALLLDPEHKGMIHQTEVLLYAASRAQHVHEKIIPALQQNRIVLCDRYIDASIAYQAYGLGIDLDVVSLISQFASSGLKPSRSYFMDLPVELSRERLLSRNGGATGAGLDRIEQRDENYHSRVRQGFLNIAASEPERVKLVKADRPAHVIAEEIAEDFVKLYTPGLRS
ncbi:dTMP kinase [Paenibacillus senegalensis]|uniref:dTMP kinase n=1 Tax=Paenibacillus senegalensis TaxID=1465766 RepID=UPI0002890B19|nr:dTMP kinase [Paenibacillus senegalensis]